MSETSELFQGGIADFICPMTNAFYEDPVVAEDRRTYSRAALLEYFDSCKQNNFQITSPLTREPMTESIVDDKDMAKAIREYKEKRKSAQGSSACIAYPLPCKTNACRAPGEKASPLRLFRNSGLCLRNSTACADF